MSWALEVVSNPQGVLMPGSLGPSATARSLKSPRLSLLVYSMRVLSFGCRGSALAFVLLKIETNAFK